VGYLDVVSCSRGNASGCMAGVVAISFVVMIVLCALQALAMSIADPETLPDMHAKKGIRSSSLHPITTWFNGAFRQLSANEAAQKVSFMGIVCWNPMVSCTLLLVI
jgi:hypothetical protein